ncbi:MAG: GTP-binding protein [Candidatus Heimdallarchaeota archaeon]|nr:GTP-binding protein [Candidatus Heimdallarchaeota archaeon]
MEVSDYIFKIIAVGNAAVGKTSLTQRFATNKFQEDYRVTLGMNLSTKDITVDNTKVQLAIWDTGGQASFEPLLPMYYKGALGALVVYDITNRKSFEAVERWFRDIRQFAEVIPVQLLGNKADLPNRKVTKEEGENLTRKLRADWNQPIHFRETSAKEDLEVLESFSVLAKTVLDLVELEMSDEEEPVFNLPKD